MNKIVFIFTLFLSINAYTCEINKYNQGIVSNINFKNKQYKSLLPISMLGKNPDFVIGVSDFPMPMSEIINIGKNVIRKLDEKLNWDVESVALYKYHYGNCKYWYYQLSFRANNQYININVGLNGEEPDLYRIDEVKLNKIR